MSDAVSNPACGDCGVALTDEEIAHGQEGLGHEGRCCECAEVGYGAPDSKINARRAAKGRPPLAVPR